MIQYKVLCFTVYRLVIKQTEFIGSDTERPGNGNEVKVAPKLTYRALTIAGVAQGG